MTINREDRERKNITTVAIYNALFYDNRKKQKALLSITLGDEKLTSLFKLRKEFIGEIRRLLKWAMYKGEKIAYFTNIEFGKSKGELNQQFNPHIHFQFFYDNFEPIKKVLALIEEKFEFKNSDIQEANNLDAYFGYIVKDYFLDNYDETLEENKMRLGMKKPLYTSSRKEISGYIIRYIYNFYKTNMFLIWKSITKKERYKFILENIRDGKILIKPFSEPTTSTFKVVKKFKIYIKI